MAKPANMMFPFILALLAASAAMQVLAGYAGDKNWLLLAAKMWQQGARLYVDIVEVNPPLVLWIYAVAVRLSHAASFLQDYNALGLLGLTGCALSVYVCACVLTLHPVLAEDKQGRLRFSLLLACLLVFYTPPTYFFDREHIMMVFAFPYIVRFAPGLAGVRVPLALRALIGVMAALAFCIKPYTVILFVGLHLLYLLQGRLFVVLRTAENIIIYSAAAAYLACIYHFTPEYVRIVFPMALATYSAFSRRLFGMFYCIIALITAGISFADFRLRFSTPYRADILYFAGVSLVCLAYALANNGWGYTYHPAMLMILYTTFWLYREYDWLKAQTGGSDKRFIFGQRACAVNFLGHGAYMLYLMAVFYATPSCEWSSDCQKNIPYLQYLGVHHIQSFGAFSEDFHKWASLARLSGARFDTRYNALWMVPRLVTEDGAARTKHAWILTNVGEGLADDLTRWQPEIVFVDSSKKFFGYDFAVDLPAFFAQVPAFAQAWSHYRYTDVIDRCASKTSGELPASSGCRYAIYQRIP